jgi:hypothetical protein
MKEISMTIARIFSQTCPPATAARILTRCAVLVPMIVAIIALAGVGESKAQIRQYQNNVFTNAGSGSVDDFEEELAKAEDDLAKVEPLDVYAGYHGDGKGDWCKDFTNPERVKVRDKTAEFRRAQLHWLDRTMTDDEVLAAVKKGKVFFTWCNSDTRVTSIMHKGGLTPVLKKEYK